MSITGVEILQRMQAKDFEPWTLLYLANVRKSQVLPERKHGLHVLRVVMFDLAASTGQFVSSRSWSLQLRLNDSSGNGFAQHFSCFFFSLRPSPVANCN